MHLNFIFISGTKPRGLQPSRLVTVHDKICIPHDDVLRDAVVPISYLNSRHMDCQLIFLKYYIECLYRSNNLFIFAQSNKIRKYAILIKKQEGAFIALPKETHSLVIEERFKTSLYERCLEFRTNFLSQNRDTWLRCYLSRRRRRKSLLFSCNIMSCRR